MPDFDRRTFLSVLAGAALAESALFAQEKTATQSLENWRSRVIQLRPEDRRDKPPVVTAIGLQPNGRQLATVGDDHLVWIWNFDTGEPMHRLDAHSDWVRSIDYSPDGRTFATAGNDRRILFWDASRGDQLAVFAEHKQAIAQIAFSHDGVKLAAVGFDDRLRIYNVSSAALANEFVCSCPDMRAVAWSPDDARLAAGGRDGKVRVWRMADGEVAHEHAVHRQRIRSLVFSPDGAQLASSSEDRITRVSKLAGREPEIVLPDRSAKVLALSFIATDLLATAGSDNLVRIWDLPQRSEVARLMGHTGSVAALMARDGQLISGGYDTTVRVWSSERPVTKVGRRPTLELPASKE